MFDAMPTLAVGVLFYIPIITTYSINVGMTFCINKLSFDHGDYFRNFRQA
jgi:hypothetical protein